MIYHDKAWPLDFIFIKVTDQFEVVNLPLCELVSGPLIKGTITEAEFKIVSKTATKDEPKETLYDRASFRDQISKELKIGNIEAYALQPEGEHTVTEVYAFLEKYKH